ncbi:hypothetical protein [Kineococcus sp. SYSU DK004]|uniref:hypothetical protein n=1 Tax=Kineococcus sp. SYSU DK004 TaxID=3383125 RepID=UPI003D7D13C6
MDPLRLARALAVVNTVADGLVVAGYQRTYDLPRSRRRLGLRAALVAGYAAVLAADDLVWAVETGARPPQPEDAALQAHESALLVVTGANAVAWGLVWWAGRGVPQAMRRRGVARPNALLGPLLGAGTAITAAPGHWAYARGRAAEVARTRAAAVSGTGGR